MPVSPPRILAPEPAGKDPLSAALEHEILAEKMATYGRLLRRLEESLAAYRESGCDDTLAAAGEALWHVVIQRDLCGFRRHDLLFAEYQVPAAVRLRMGLVRTRRTPA